MGLFVRIRTQVAAKIEVDGFCQFGIYWAPGRTRGVVVIGVTPECDLILSPWHSPETERHSDYGEAGQDGNLGPDVAASRQ